MFWPQFGPNPAEVDVQSRQHFRQSLLMNSNHIQDSPTTIQRVPAQHVGRFERCFLARP
jgi:hypothetical protein